jgi:hypothetical protein
MSKVLQFSDSLLMYGKAKVAAQSDNFTQTGMVRSKMNVSRKVERCGVQDKLCKNSMGMDLKQFVSWEKLGNNVEQIWQDFASGFCCPPAPGQ